MNLSRFLPFLLVLGAMLLLLGVSRIAAEQSGSERYKTCSALTVNNPAGALEVARAWRSKNASSPFARHCEAVALYRLKDYPGAAKEFLELSRETETQNPALSLKLLLQAADALSASGQHETAVAALSERLNAPLPNSSKIILLIARARIYGIDKQPLLAVQDADQALALDPSDVSAKALLDELQGKR